VVGFLPALLTGFRREGREMSCSNSDFGFRISDCPVTHAKWWHLSYEVLSYEHWFAASTRSLQSAGRWRGGPRREGRETS